MADNHVLKYGDPVLREKCRPVTVFDEELKKLAEKMFSIMRSANGIGLAAAHTGGILHRDRAARQCDSARRPSSLCPRYPEQRDRKILKKGTAWS